MRFERASAGVGLRIGASAGALALLGSVLLNVLPNIFQVQFPFGVAIQFSVSLTIIGLQWDIFNILKSKTELGSRTNKLMEALEVSDLHEEELVNLCHSAAMISGKKDIPGWVVKDVEKTIASLSKSFGELNHENAFEMDTESRLLDYLNELSQASDEFILATSAIDGVDSDFWEQENGRTYLTIQGGQKRKHPDMVLRRVFLINQQALANNEKNQSMIRIIKEHEAAGFEVGVLTQGAVDDFVVFDREATVFSKRGSTGAGARGGVVDFNRDTVEAQTKRFYAFWETAATNRRKYWQ